MCVCVWQHQGVAMSRLWCCLLNSWSAGLSFHWNLLAGYLVCQSHSGREPPVLTLWKQCMAGLICLLSDTAMLVERYQSVNVIQVLLTRLPDIQSSMSASDNSVTHTMYNLSLILNKKYGGGIFTIPTLERYSRWWNQGKLRKFLIFLLRTLMLNQ